MNVHCLLVLLCSLVPIVLGQFRLTEMYTYGGGASPYGSAASGYGAQASVYSQQYNYPYSSYYSQPYGGPAYSGAYYNDPFYYTNNYRPASYNLPAYAPYYQPSGLFGLWGTRRKGHSDRYGGNNGFNWGCFPNKC